MVNISFFNCVIFGAHCIYLYKKLLGVDFSKIITKKLRNFINQIEKNYFKALHLSPANLKFLAPSIPKLPLKF